MSREDEKDFQVLFFVILPPSLLCFFLPLCNISVLVFIPETFKGLDYFLKLRVLIEDDLGIMDWLKRGSILRGLVRTNFYVGCERERAVLSWLCHFLREVRGVRWFLGKVMSSGFSKGVRAGPRQFGCQFSRSGMSG